MVEIGLLKEFIRICHKYELRWFCLGGTLLGAIRHQGFIPWDDDIDVGMPRKDFIRFEQIISEELPEGMRYLSYRTDPSYRRYVPRLCNERVKVIDTSAATPREQGAWIDIFPLDGMPAGHLVKKIHAFRMLARRALLNLSLFSTNIDLNRKNRPLVERFLISAGRYLPLEKVISTDRQLKALDHLMQMYDYDASSWVINFMGIHKMKEMFPKRYYKRGTFYPFEDIFVRGPVDYDAVLTQMYGDYMEMPPAEEMNHHNTRILQEKETEPETYISENPGPEASEEMETDPFLRSYSVLMSVYEKDDAEYLKKSIRSMERQTLPFSQLVLVCDGPLTEDLEQVVRDTKERLKERMTVVRLPENAGLGRALRIGVQACRYPAVARMDADDISRPSRCEKEMQVLNRGYDLVGAGVREFKTEPGDEKQYRILPETEQKIRAVSGKRNPFNHGTVMFRKKAVLDAGSYKDFPGFEDYCLWIRMLQNGARVCNLPEVLLDMRTGNGFSSRRGGKEYLRQVVRFQKFLRKRRYISRTAYIKNCAVRGIVAYLPKGLREKFYSCFLRKR